MSRNLPGIETAPPGTDGSWDGDGDRQSPGGRDQAVLFILPSQFLTPSLAQSGQKILAEWIALNFIFISSMSYAAV
jgi:hypothetical protein